MSNQKRKIAAYALINRTHGPDPNNHNSSCPYGELLVNASKTLNTTVLQYSVFFFFRLQTSLLHASPLKWHLITHRNYKFQVKPSRDSAATEPKLESLPRRRSCPLLPLIAQWPRSQTRKNALSCNAVE